MLKENELPWTRKLALSLTALLIGLALLAVLGLVAEMTLRWLGPKSDPMKLGVRLEGSGRHFGLKPNVRSMQTGVWVETNSLGFREKEYSVARSPGVRRLVVLGDSYTFGVGVEFLQTFSKVLEAELNAARGPHEVINFGVGGYNTVMELATLREVAARFRPDLVIIAYVLNDTERSGPSDVDSQAGGGRRPLINTIHHKLKQVSMAYTYLAPKIGAAFGVLFNGRYAVGGTREIIESYHEESPGWIEARQAILDIATEARKIGAPAVVVVFPMMIDFSTYPLRSAHETITRFCQHNGIPVLDLLPRFANEEASDLAIFLDGHPNAGAHKIFADEILHYLSHTDASLMHAAIASAQHERTLALRPAGSHSSRLSAMRELPTRTTAP